ncbi:MAG TPA: GTP-binding protein [Cellulomonas sp.]|nr:GTP-binding protein [Cellulomonas sp.]
MSNRKPLVVLATVDPVLRDVTVFGMVVDHPRLVVLRHDIQDDEDGGSIRRVVVSADGVVEDVVVPLEHACLSCAVREDALPTLERLARDARWDAVMLALPVSAESLPVTRALAWATRRSGPLRHLRMAGVASAVDLGTFEDDLLGDDLLDERGLALTADDRRAVGEALAAQVAHVDAVLVHGDAAAFPVSSDLLDHVRAADGRRLDATNGTDPRALLGIEHRLATGDRRLDPLHAAPARSAPTEHGVWTLDLASERALHPERLVEEVHRLGSGRLRSRGRFWVPTRPDSLCVWEGVGGQLSIGEMGRWGRRDADTRLIFTGTDDSRAALVEAFEDVLVTGAEHAAGLAPWLGRPDVLAPWLGSRSPA